MSWIKLCPNLSFTVENKMCKSHKKDGLILNLNQCLRYSIPLDFKNLTMNWEKHFPLAKREWTHWEFCPYEKIFCQKGPVDIDF